MNSTQMGVTRLAGARGAVMPVYVAVDESVAMTRYRERLANGMVALCDALRAEPMAAAGLRLTIVGYDGASRQLLGLCDPRAITRAPEPVIGNAASQRALFADLLRRLPRDARRLASKGCQVQRPAVFILTNGPLADPASWEAAWRQLVGGQALTPPPHVFAFGVDAARADEMQQIATQPGLAYLAPPGPGTAGAVDDFFRAVSACVLQAGQALGDPQACLRVSEPGQFARADGEPGPVLVPVADVAAPAPNQAAATIAALTARLGRWLRRPLAAPLRAGARAALRTRLGQAGAAIAVTSALALAAGLLTWTALAPVGPPTAGDSQPFDAALEALVYAPVVSYQTATGNGKGQVDVQVTASGDLIGTISEGGQAYQLLQLGGQFYLRASAAALGLQGSLDGTVLGGHWLTGQQAERTVGWSASQFPSPSTLAIQLASALGNSPSYRPGSDVDGVPVLAATTSLGTLYVARQPPYRVVSLVPAETTSPATSAASAASSAAPGGPERAVTLMARLSPARGAADPPVEYLPASASSVESIDDALAGEAQQAATAIDLDVTAGMTGSVAGNCSDSGCEAVDSETVSVASSSGSTASASVTATMVADFTVDGIPAGSCENTVSLPADGTGEIDCSDPSAGSVYSSEDALKQAEAEAAGEAAGQTSGTYTVQTGVQDYVYATVVPSQAQATPAESASQDATLDQGLVNQGAGLQAGTTSCGQSFSPGTRVLLADGKAAPIAGLKPGKRIAAMSTGSGKRGTVAIGAVLVNYDKDLLDVTVRTGGSDAVISTTADHLFWDQTLGRWTEAARLRVGDLLGTAGGAAVVARLSEPPATGSWMWDLSVPAFHDFYIATGKTAVLVHNCDQGTIWDYMKATAPDIPNSQIPESFVLSAGDAKVWVIGSATKHLPQYLNSAEYRVSSRFMLQLVQQALLTSFRAAVAEATAGGVRYGLRFEINGWDLIFSPPRSGQLPVLFHAVYQPPKSSPAQVTQ